MKKTFLFLTMLLGVVCVTLTSCGDDEPVPGGGGEDNTTDVAVTGSVEELGADYAQISGLVNLNVITVSYSNVDIGVEVSTSSDFAGKMRFKATGLVGRAFTVKITSLRPETKYYYRTYVSVSTLSYDYYGITQTFTTEKSCTPGPSSGNYVDLGLPSGTLWATYNVGGSSPEDYGDCFAWGETSGYNSGKTDFSLSTYKFNNEWGLTKYCSDSDFNGKRFTDTLTELELEDDAAYVNWGSNWRMPTIDQFNELINSENTTTEWTTQNGVYGRKITSKTNGNSLFLPAAGARNETFLSDAGSGGYYWSRTLITSYPISAYYLYFNSGNIGTNDYYFYRNHGGSVRPVRVSK